MRWLVVVVLGACGFRADVEGAHDGGVDTRRIDLTDADETVDAPDAPPPVALCNSNDATLRACYTFDGDTADGSQYNHDATATGTTFGSGHNGQALAIGANALVTVAASSNLDVTQLTIKMWIRATTIPTGIIRAGLVDSGNRYRMFLLADGVVRCATTGGPALLTPINAVAVNTWTHLTCTYDGATMRIYIDGVLAATRIQTSTIPTGAGLVIGHNNPTGEIFDGSIDELQIFGAIVPP